MKNKLLIGISILSCALLITGCTTKLKNGEEVLVSFNNGSIVTEDLYDALKEKYGASELIDLIDTMLLSKKYSEDSSEKSYISEQVETVENKAEKNDTDFNDYIEQYYSVNSKDALKEYGMWDELNSSEKYDIIKA